jgi:hypothetical protein
MSISLTCQCGKPFKVKNKFAGKRFLCDACHRPVLVPGISEDGQNSEIHASEIEDETPAAGAAETHAPATQEIKAPADRKKWILLATVAVVAFAFGWATAYFDLIGPPRTASNSLDNFTDGLAKGGGQSGAMITAEPNPVRTFTKGRGSTTLTWDTGDAAPGEVYGSVNGRPEDRIAAKQAKGSKVFPWIDRGNVYVFRLYAGDNKSKLLASVKVTTE